MNQHSLPIAIFASGTGTNALQLLSQKKELSLIHIPVIIVDRADSPLPAKVKSLYPEVDVQVIPFAINKAEHETRILEALRAHSIQWIFLAGFMRILGPTLLNAFRNPNGAHRVVNIHPSLLPAYPGTHSYERAFQDQVSESGITVHLVDSGVDTGPILAQLKFPRRTDDTLETFKERGLALEWEIYKKILHELDQRGTLG